SSARSRRGCGGPVADAPPVRRGERGFTLLELLVAAVVLLVAVLLAAKLLDESGRVLAHSVARARDPWSLLATELLRNDLRSGYVAVPPESSTDPLALVLPTGPVVWHRDGDALVRDAPGGASRPLLHGVERWSWRLLPGGVVDVEVS